MICGYLMLTVSSVYVFSINVNPSAGAAEGDGEGMGKTDGEGAREGEGVVCAGDSVTWDGVSWDGVTCDGCALSGDISADAIAGAGESVALPGAVFLLLAHDDNRPLNASVTIRINRIFEFFIRRLRMLLS
jgi:hypothetical protein